MINIFKNLIDNSEASSGSREKYGYTTSTNTTNESGITTSVTLDPIKNRIVDLLKPIEDGEKIESKILGNFEKELVYRYILFNEDYQNYLPVLKALLDNIRLLVDSGLKPLTYKKEWIEALSLMKEMMVLGNYSFCTVNPSNLRREYPKHFDAAKSVSTLKEKYRWHVSINENSDIFIEKGVEKTTKAIEKMISEIGGLILIEHIFNFLGRELYNDGLQRYLIGRKTSMTTYDIKPDVPIGYLLNISLKYPYKSKVTENTGETLTNIINDSTLLCNALFQSQHYSIWEIIFSNGNKIVDLVRDIAIYDSVFSFPQGDIEMEMGILSNVLTFISDEDFAKNCGFTLKSFLSVMTYIHKTSNETHLPMIFYKSTVNKELKLQKNEINNILELLSHEPLSVNSEYIVPSEQTKTNYWRRPLIKSNSNTFVLINKSWCAKSFYEALTEKLRIIPNFDANFGLKIEGYIKSLCDKQGITHSSGKYKESGVTGECDLVIETEDKIILFEIKKKSLTYKAKSGSDNEIIIDIAQSLLESQIQASRTELLLLEKGSILLKDEIENKEYTLTLNNRQVQRVSVTHLDFRGFHDTLFVKNFLETLLSYDVLTNSSDEKIKEKFDKINRKVSTLREQYYQYLKLNSNHDRILFFNSYFHNIDHLILMLKMSNDNKSFYDILISNKHVNATGSLNFYKEFVYTYMSKMETE